MVVVVALTARAQVKGYKSVPLFLYTDTKGHGEGQEGDEGDADDAQGLTETRGARGREGEGDKSEEATVHTGRDCAAMTTTRRGRKRRGKRAKAHGDDEAELVDKLGRARASRSCATVANSG